MLLVNQLSITRLEGPFCAICSALREVCGLACATNKRLHPELPFPSLRVQVLVTVATQCPACTADDLFVLRL